MTNKIFVMAAIAISLASCKKEGCTDDNALNFNEKATKNDDSCEYSELNSYTIPSTYSFVDGNGNSTVSYSGQTDRLNQLFEMVTYSKSGNAGVISAVQMKDMFSNSNNPFSFTSTKQLKNKCFSLDVTYYEDAMDKLALASQDHTETATSGQAGVLTSGSSTYLFDANGVEQVQIIEKGLMGAVFMYQALNTYFSSSKMDVDNTTSLDPGAGKHYTAMEHHWDEAFGYFGVDTDFPSSIPTLFWGKYCNAQNAGLNSNSIMMSNFLKGRAAISNNVIADRNEAIQQVRIMWENISANQAISYLNQAISLFGVDNAKYLHVLSKAYAFAFNLRYASVETRRMDPADHAALMAQFDTNMWNITLQDLNAIKATLESKY